MATQSFGASFGDPSKYMGKSPLARIGEAGKKIGAAYLIQESGLENFLNNSFGIKKDNEGNYTVNGAAPPPKQGAVPVSPAMPAAVPTPVGQPQMAPTPPANQSIGNDILDDKYYGAPTSFVNPMNINDINPVPLQDGYTQQLAGDNDYQSIPGYGSTVKKFMQFAGMT
jgi:hypothetical protein